MELIRCCCENGMYMIELFPPQETGAGWEASKKMFGTYSIGQAMAVYKAASKVPKVDEFREKLQELAE